MAAPWGDSRYPPFPSPYPPAGPPPHNSRQQQPHPAIPQAVPGFYNPAIFPNQPYGPASTPPIASIPPVLKPGGAPHQPQLHGYRSYSKELSGDIFFGAPAFPQPQIPSQPLPQQGYPPPQHVHPPPSHLHQHPPQIRHSVSSPAPPVPHRPDYGLPPLPPKPQQSPPNAAQHPGGYPHARTGMHERSPQRPPKILTDSPTERRHTSMPPRDSLQVQNNEASELERVLELSALDAEAAKKREDEELARALEASLQVTSPQPMSPSTSYFPKMEQVAGSSTAANGYHAHGLTSQATASVKSSYSPLPSPSSFASSSVSLPPVNSAPHESYILDDQSKYTSSPPSKVQQILSDEAFARQLIEEERRAAMLQEKQAAAQNVQTPASAPPTAQASVPELRLPRYDDVVSAPSTSNNQLAPLGFSQSAPVTAHTSPNLSTLAPLPSPVAQANGSQPSPARSRPPSPPPMLGRSTSANAVPTLPSAPNYELEARTGRSQSFGGYGGRGAARPPMTESLTEPNRTAPHTPSQSVRSAPLPSVSEEERARQPGEPTPSPPLKPNQFIDNELLRGVSIGFSPPIMTAELTPMKGPIPNVIGLPYGRAPPLHFKAPNWHDILKLMARMSGTHIEATVEAMAVVKTPMQLRLVVNFVKVHQSSNDWHVIIYMTIDMPIPQDHRYRFRNSSDPGLLPYSYTLSPTPAFLRENADGPMSKWYTIPSTAQIPYPTLPITFPDLATYLMSALENARRAIHDRSSGWYRLAKCVDTFYPVQTVKNDDEEEERKGLSERVGRFFGRGNKPSRHDNDERSNLVTPFFADDYGR